MAFNYHTDQSLVLHQDTENRYWNIQAEKPWRMPANYRYLKTLYLLEHPADFDNLLMASSRAGSMDTRILGDRWFKYNFSLAMLQDHEQHLEVLLRQGLKPKHIIIGMDRFNFYSTYPHDHVLYKPYPLNWQEHIKLLGFYLFKRPSGLDLDILMGRAVLKPADGAIHDNGSPWTPEDKQQRLAKKTQWEAALLASGPFRATLDHTSLQADAALASLARIQQLSRQHNIKLTLYMQPFHYKNYLAMNHDELDMIMARIARIQPFHDFSGLHEYSTDNFYWKETSHFLAPVNNHIAKVLSGHAAPRDNFGRLITPDNVLTHRRQQRQTIAERLSALRAYDANIVLHPSLAY